MRSRPSVSALRGIVLAVALLGLGAGYSSTASAQRSSLNDRVIGVGMSLHAGGEVEYNGRFDDGLKATPGLRVHWDKLLGGRSKGKVVLGGSLGILGRVSWWEQDAPGADRNTLFDVALRGRFLIGFRDFVFYLGPAIGPTILSILNNDYGGDERARPGLNLTFVALGFEWWWNSDHALFTEIGYAGHWLYHDDIDPRLNQAQMAFGVDFGR